tara:strand:+ start:301 stop:507 length:207 start_codon:yes stop_codon:yes gene_type:complete
MIAIPERYKEELTFGEALEIVQGEDNDLLLSMETIKATSEVKILSMSDMLTYNAYNVVFNNMRGLFHG